MPDCLPLSVLYIVCKYIQEVFFENCQVYSTTIAALTSVNIHSILLSLAELWRAGRDASNSILCAGGKFFTGSSGIQGLAPKAYCRPALLS